MTVGGILGEAWKLYTRFFTRFFAVAAIVFLVVNLVNAVIGSVVGSGGGLAVVLVLVSWAVSLVGTFWLQGALVYAVADVRDGRIDSTIGELFERVRPYLGTLILAGILAALGIAIGLVFLIVPGLILLTWWCLIVPVIVMEGKPVGEAFSRSRELVRGHGWTALAVVLIAAVASAIASGLIEAIFSFLDDFLRYWIGGTIASAVVGPFVAIALTVMFFRLQEARADVAPPAVASDTPAAT